jgi:bis(5'-nucleosidyl)-tetraphosphatase
MHTDPEKRTESMESGKSYPLSAGVVLVRWEGDVPLYLLLRCYRNWDLPKGMVEKGEDPLQAAIRELQEETSISEIRFRWGHGYSATPPYSYGKIARFYVAETKQCEVVLGINPKMGKAEHDEHVWVTYLEAKKLLVPRLQRILDWAHEQVVATRSHTDSAAP